MVRLCGYNTNNLKEMTARTEASIRRMGDLKARYFCVAKEDVDGSEAR